MTQATTLPRSNRRKWILSIVVGLLLLCAAGVVVIVLSSCSVNKYVIAAGLPTPDRAYQTGSLYGYNVYIWDCYQNKHIVLYHYTSEMTSGAFSREESACGATTPIETKLAPEKKRDLRPSAFW